MRSLFFIVARSLRQHLLSTIITVISAGLASGLVMSVFTVSEQSRTAFTGGDIGYDAVLGAKGSQLQLVLCTRALAAFSRRPSGVLTTKK